MKRPLLLAAAAAASLVAAAPAAAQRYSPPPPAYPAVSPEELRFQQAQERFDRELDLFEQEFDRYRQYRASNPGWRGGGPGYDNRYYNDDRDEGGYDPSRYYRSGPQYRERVLGSDDRVYRGSDGRYYCKRSDGTTGLIVGGATGALLGNVIDGGHSRTVGTLIGAAIGAAVGASVERNQQEMRCR